MPLSDFAFGPFRFDVEQKLLFRDGAILPVGRRGGLILNALLQRKGQIVTKSVLIDAAWPDENVEESNLSVQVAKLRQLLGPKWIRTIERVGYQMVTEAAPASARTSMPTIVIMPFAGNGLDAGDAVADLVPALAPFRSLQILADTDTPIADYRLEGSLERVGGKLLLKPRLIDLRACTYRWAERFEVDDNPADRERLAGRIASIVENEIELAEIGRWSDDGDVADIRALYQRARFHLRTSRPADYAIATSLLERALGLEPENVYCLAAMCEALHHRIAMGWPALSAGDAEHCLAYGERGLDQPAIDGYATALFGTAIYRTGDQDRGYALMQRGGVLNPNSLMALIYAATASLHWGSLEEAETLFRRTLELHPRHPAQGFAMGGLARIKMIAGGFQEALGWAQQAYLANPNYGATHWTLIAANAHLQRYDEAERQLKRFRALQPGVTIDAIRSGQPTRQSRMSSTLEGLEIAGMH